MAEYLIQDTTLEAIADAINAKTGGSSTMTPAEMVTAINNIPSGPTQPTITDYLNNNVHNYQDDSITKIGNYKFFRNKAFSGYFRVPNCTTIELDAFYLGGGFSSFFAPKATVGAEAFRGCDTRALTIVVGGPSSADGPFRHYAGTAILETIEFAMENPSAFAMTIYSYAFEGVASLKTLIFRSNTPLVLSSLGAFNGTPFASGGTGGTIYIPKALYDHIGDGTSLDYKAATNWSTLDGYGTITWAQIEGSIYETQYADGTPIPSE